MSRILRISSLLILAFQAGAVNVPLTIQEAIYPGASGINRASDPVTVGIPLPDDPTNGASSVSQLGLSGSAVGQFRVLGQWPSGRIKWVLIDAQASLNAGQTASISLVSGSGNFGGSNLATDNGSTISIDTGSAQFTIKKANFNGLDQVVVGGKTVVASGSSQGFVVTGPAPGQTTCPCSTIYSSANDPSSTAVIEENGPAKAVIRATGSHVDGAGNAYMHFTARIYFYKGKSFVKITSILRNADYGTSNTFATAFKGHQGYELRIAPNLSGVLNYSFGNHTASPTTGTMSGTDSIYLYQGESQSLKWSDWCGFGCVPYTNDTGYSIVKNGTTLINGSDTQYPQGWADISDSTGTGVEIGVYQLSAYWPKSLEFNNGGSDVRIGIWARQNSQPYYQSWPQWSIHDLYVNFHASALASPANEFLKFQHYLVGRASYTWYNSTSVFPYTLIDPTTEDNYYRSVQQAANPASIAPGSACCIQDFGITDLYLWPLHIFRFYAWHSGGGANQTEFRWSYLLNFITRGMTGRYLEAAHFYRFQAETAWPHSDGFRWMDHPGEYDGFGFPTAASANSNLSFRDWLDQEHGHWYGMTDFYFMTGDETIRDALLDGAKEWFLNSNTYQAGLSGGLYNSRSVGIQLTGSARMAQFLQAIGDPDASTVLAQGASTYNIQVKPDLCVSGYPAGCSIGGPIDGGPFTTQGVSRVRGVPWGSAGTTGTWCGVSHAYRTNSSFQASILIHGILEYRNAQGPSWPEYWNSLDLAYGIARWNLSEVYVDDGSGRWDINGFRFSIILDRPNNCTQPGETTEPDFQPTATQTTTMTFLAKYLVDRDTSWATKFNINMQKNMSALGMATSDFGSYQLAHIISILSNPGSLSLVTAPITSFVDNGGGSYTIGWNVPSGAQSYRIKWGAKQIVDWVGFDPANGVFIGNPSSAMPWFAANNAPNIPAPGPSGTSQTLTINTGVTGLTAQNFMVKAYVQSGGGSPSLVIVSGNNQTGTVGQPLANPFVVKAVDGSGAPISGITVTFTITSGGGSLSNTSATTDSNGLASTTLTPGPGTNTVTASSGSLSPVTFTATTSGPAYLLMVSGNKQSGPAGQPLPKPLIVKVTDGNRNGVPGVPVTFTVTNGGGSLSSVSTATDSYGLASARLTLGPTAGSNTVSVSSGTLAGSPLTFTETALSPPSGSGPTTISWSLQPMTSGWPAWIGWLELLFDPISQQTIFYVSPGYYTGIYSTHLFFYNPSTNVFTDMGGTSSTGDACPADTPTQPGDRHPVGQIAIDTKRNFLWLYGGLNVNCADNPHHDMYYLTLNPNPLNNVWHQVNPAHIPLANGASAMVYDPDDDVLFAFGSDAAAQTNDNWVYCRTAENPTPGVLTAKQTAAGCTAPDDWSQVAVTGGVQPRGVATPGMVYDTVTKKAILFGGSSSGLTIAYNETWAYDIPTRTWTQKALSTQAPPPYAGSSVAHPAMTYNPITHHILYHQTSNTGAPADWEYDPVADTWTKLSSTGGGPARDAFMAYDPTRNVLVTWSQNQSTFMGEVFVGSMSSGAASNSCDLNLDGAVNVLDVQIAVNQAAGQTPCTTADLNGDHICNGVDVQRFVSASLGSACQTGP